MVRDELQEKIIYANLNESMVILAPPGCGKTYTMAKRIDYLINNDKIEGNRKILGLTFSNAAANEMYEKLEVQGSHLKSRVRILNYHAFCYKILRSHGDKIGITRDFAIISSIERKKRLKDLFLQIEIDEDDGMKFITKIDESIHNKKTLLENVVMDKFLKKRIVRAYDQYVQSLINEDKMDFDLIIEKVIELWDEKPEYLDLYRKKYQYLIIDEFQDTNQLQYEIVRRLIGFNLSGNQETKDFQCYCDPFQSIYLFQGALAKRFDLILDEFNPQLMSLDKNYRTSSKLIQDICYCLRGGEKITDDNDENVNCYIFNNQENESDFVLNTINGLVDDEIHLEEICVISRTYERLNVVKSLLDERRISYIYLKDFRSEVIEEKFYSIFLPFDILISEKKTNGSIIDTFLETCERNGYDRDDIVINTIHKFILKLERNLKFKKLRVWQKALEIKNDIYLEMNWGAVVRENTKDKIFLSVVHQVKGMEFNNVLFLGLENYELPSGLKCYNKCSKHLDQDMSEEENIFYVGVSRTISELVFTSSKKVIKKGVEKKRSLSCFINKIRQFVRLIDHDRNKPVNYSDVKCWNS
ncbi:MAG TPA: ATP-dependent helicase [archaeon]|nr:ATP-dependent helicase [archaeon]